MSRRRRDRSPLRGPWVAFVSSPPGSVCLDDHSLEIQDRIVARRQEQPEEDEIRLSTRQLQRVGRAYAALSDLEKDTLQLLYGTGKVERDVACILGRTQQAVNHRLVRTFRKLAARLLLPPQVTVHAIADMAATVAPTQTREEHELCARWLLGLAGRLQPTTANILAKARSGRSLDALILRTIQHWRNLAGVRTRRDQ